VVVGNINSSGRLVETYVKDVLNTTPSAGNTGNYVYVDSQGNDTGRRYVNYDEGIYVGYRYFETRFGEDQAEYDSIVQYPFGYGLIDETSKRCTIEGWQSENSFSKNKN
jgi:beta-glucosidase